MSLEENGSAVLNPPATPADCYPTYHAIILLIVTILGYFGVTRLPDEKIDKYAKEASELFQFRVKGWLGLLVKAADFGLAVFTHHKETVTDKKPEKPVTDLTVSKDAEESVPKSESDIEKFYDSAVTALHAFSNENPNTSSDTILGKVGELVAGAEKFVSEPVTAFNEILKRAGFNVGGVKL